MKDSLHRRSKAGSVLACVMSLLFLFAAFFSASAYSASKTVLVLGDSLSAEYGLSRGSGWVSLLEKRLATEKIGAAIVNASISGETTSGGLARLPALLSQHTPAIVVIELGANDALRGLPMASTEKNIKTMINAVQQAGAKVLLVGMQIPPNYGKEYADRFSGMYAKIAREQKVALVPFFLDKVVNDDNLFQPDRIHPTAQAQPIMLNNVWPHLKPLLQK
jgi:acyl-CoA thioesterase-1